MKIKIIFIIRGFGSTASLSLKKKAGSFEDYHTLATKQIYDGNYDRDNPEKNNLLPLNKWIGISTQVRNLKDGSVHIEFWVDRPKDDREAVGNWEPVIEATDRGELDRVYGKSGRGGYPFRFYGCRVSFIQGQRKKEKMIAKI